MSIGQEECVESLAVYYALMDYYFHHTARQVLFIFRVRGRIRLFLGESRNQTGETFYSKYCEKFVSTYIVNLDRV